MPEFFSRSISTRPVEEITKPFIIKIRKKEKQKVEVCLSGPKNKYYEEIKFKSLEKAENFINFLQKGFSGTEIERTQHNFGSVIFV